MPDKNVQLPDGRVVAFPDSMADADIAAVIKKQLGPQKTERAMQQTMGGPPMFTDVPAGEKEAFESAGQKGYQTGGKIGAALVSTPGAIANPAAAIGALAGGKAGEYGAHKGAEALGASPEVADIAGDIGGVIGGFAGGGAGIKGKGLLPSAERAGASLGAVKGVAGEVPIDMTRPGNTALELYEQSQRGASLPKVIRDFLKRATAPGDEPITYGEAKDFQSNVSSLSAEERMSIKPNTKRLLGQLNADLKESLASAADTVGKGEQFGQAMREYHNAMTIKGMTETAKEYAWKAAVTGTLGALGYKAFKMITE